MRREYEGIRPARHDGVRAATGRTQRFRSWLSGLGRAAATSPFRSQTRRHLTRNFASIFTWQGMNYVLPLITLPYLARVLGAEHFGILGFVGSVAAYAVLVGDWGFVLSATQAVAANRHDPPALNRVIWDTFTAKALLGAISLILLLLVTEALPRLHAYEGLILFAWLQVPGNLITADWLLQGLERMGAFALASTLGKLMVLPLLFALVRSPADLPLAVLLQSATNIVAGAISLFLAIRTGTIGRPALSLARTIKALRGGAYVFASHASISLYTNLNVIAVFALAGPLQGGLFVGAEKLRRAAQALLGPVSMVMYPRISAMMGTARKQALVWVRMLLVIQTLFTLVLAAATWILAPLAIRLVLGPSFAPAAQVLRAASPVLVLDGINTILVTQLLLPLGMRREFLLATAGPGLLSLSYMPVLAATRGAVGVALALCVTELVALVFALAFLYRRGTFAEMASAARDARAAACDATAGPGPARPSGPVSPETPCQCRAISRPHNRGDRCSASRANSQSEP
jgi:O-antigen/teichoic acid export membrane protein